MNAPSPAWQSVATGSISRFRLPVAARADGSAVELPILVARGSSPGKTLLVTAGVHGDEFEGMVALQRVFESLDASKMRGTLAAVTRANPPAFEAGLRVNPDDRQDLARVFPGHPQGTVTERMADCLTQRFIRHADFYCDLHSAGQYYGIDPWVGYQLHQETLAAQREASGLFGLPIVWGTPGLPGRSLSAAADHNVPAIYAEVTGAGRCLESDVRSYVHGVQQLLAWLQITPEQPQPYEPQLVVEDETENAGFLQMQNRAGCGGLFEATARLGEQMRQGQQIGVIRDPLGEELQSITATSSGRLVFLRTFSRVLPGDAICTVLGKS